jgi:V8-like Glu-specific endopeptidase
VGCYTVFIPSAFWTTSTGPENDFALIEFGCNLNPGNSVGAHGSWTASDTQISSSSVMVSGYPSQLPSSVNTAILVPNLVTHTIGAGGTAVMFGTPAVLNHSVDATNAQSGSPLLQTIFGGSALYVTGFHNGSQGFVGPNKAKRFDGTVYGMLKSYTSY